MGPVWPLRFQHPVEVGEAPIGANNRFTKGSAANEQHCKAEANFRCADPELVVGALDGIKAWNSSMAKRLLKHERFFFAYVLGSRNKNDCRTYVGWTTDLERRLRQHNAGISDK